MVASEEIAKAAQAIVNEFLEIISKKTGLHITDKKVAAITRKLITNLNSTETKRADLREYKNRK